MFFRPIARIGVVPTQRLRPSSSQESGEDESSSDEENNLNSEAAARPTRRVGVVPTKRQYSEQEESSSESDEENEGPNFGPAKKQKQHPNFKRGPEYFSGNDCGCHRKCFSQFTLSQCLQYEEELKNFLSRTNISLL